MIDEEETFFIDGEIVTAEELELILRALCIDLVRLGLSEVRIEHEEHLTLQ